MIVTGIDFETTGTAPATDRVIEVGAILWDTENGGYPLRKDMRKPDADIEIAEAGFLVKIIATKD